MQGLDPTEFPVLIGGGRTTVRERRVRLGDVNASGEVRLDALACYLQDIAADDADGAGIVGTWVLRRVAIAVVDLPQLGDDIELTTFCSGFGSRWAERRTTTRVGADVVSEAAAIWVYIDDDGRARPLPPWFSERYGADVADRKVSSRLRRSAVPEGAASRPWPLRATDFDVLEHVNNAATWAAVEDERARRAPNQRVRRAEIEYRAAIDPGEEVELRSTFDDSVLDCWLTCGEQVRASARLRFA